MARTKDDLSVPITERRLSLPPDADAIREALKTPPRPRLRIGAMIGLCALLGLLATFLIPREPPTDVGRADFGSSVSHPRGFRIDAPLRREAEEDRTFELEGVLLFRYASADDDFVAAHIAITDNWDRTAVHLSHIIRGYSRRDFVESFSSINERLRADVSTRLFPNQEARVTKVGWRFVRFR